MLTQVLAVVFALTFFLHVHPVFAAGFWRSELRSLIIPIAEGEVSADTTRFSELVGQQGFKPLTAEDLRIVANHFERFEFALADAQRPGVASRFWPEVHELFRIKASYRARKAMSASLRPWLRGDSLDASLDDRVAAAEYLSDYWDAEAVPLIAALLDSVRRDDEASEAAWYLRQALRRLHDPRGGIVFRHDADGTVTLLKEPGEIVRATASPGEHELTREEAAEILRFLDGASVTQVGPSRGLGYPKVRIEFSDGIVAIIGRGSMGGRYVCRDNHRMTASRVEVFTRQKCKVYEALNAKYLGRAPRMSN